MNSDKTLLLLCHDLTTRLQLTNAFTAAGIRMLKPDDPGVPDCIVVDLGRRDALEQIAALRQRHPGVGIIACAAGFEDDAVAAAKAAGANDFAARSFVERRVARRLKSPA